jgi:hypothetical protein
MFIGVNFRSSETVKQLSAITNVSETHITIVLSTTLVTASVLQIPSICRKIGLFRQSPSAIISLDKVVVEFGLIPTPAI